MCDRLAFMEMTDAEKAAVIADYAWMSRQFADRRADERARAERYARPLSPLVAAPDLPPVAHPWSVRRPAPFRQPRQARRETLPQISFPWSAPWLAIPFQPPRAADR